MTFEGLPSSHSVADFFPAREQLCRFAEQKSFGMKIQLCVSVQRPLDDDPAAPARTHVEAHGRRAQLPPLAQRNPTAFDRSYYLIPCDVSRRLAR